jgi:preprotein translocase subunit YajC
MEATRLLRVKLCQLVPIVVLVGAVMFCMSRSDEEAEEDQSKSKSEKVKSE